MAGEEEATQCEPCRRHDADAAKDDVNDKEKDCAAVQGRSLPPGLSVTMGKLPLTVKLEEAESAAVKDESDGDFTLDDADEEADDSDAHTTTSSAKQSCPRCLKVFSAVAPFTQHLIACCARPKREAVAAAAVVDKTDRGWSHTGKARRTCPKCKRGYSSLMCYSKHVRRCGTKKVAEEEDAAKKPKPEKANVQPKVRRCNVCLRDIHHMYARHMRQHAELFDLDETVVCPSCQDSFKRADLNAHFASAHGSERGACVVCRAVLPRADVAAHHRRHELQQRPHLCPTCGEAFHTGRELSRHVRKAHDDGKTDEDEPPVVCEQCGRQYGNRHKLVAHIRMVHDRSREFGCHLCAKVFYEKGKLTKHLSVHSDVKPYCCAHCDYRSVRTDNVRLHVRKVHRREAVADDVIRVGRIEVRGVADNGHPTRTRDLQATSNNSYPT